MSAVLFYAIGYPGAGKTALAINLANKLPARHVHGDRIGYELFVHPKFTPDEVSQVRRVMEQQTIESLARGESVIYDAMLHTVSMRQRLIELASAQNAQSIGLWVRIPVQMARERASTVRTASFAEDYKRMVPTEIFDCHLQIFEEPGPNEVIITVRGNDPFSAQYQCVAQRLDDLGVTLPPAGA